MADDVDPTEGIRRWTSTLFLVALAITFFPIAVWEMVVRHAADYGVLSSLTGAAGLIVTGGILLERKGRA